MHRFLLTSLLILPLSCSREPVPADPDGGPPNEIYPVVPETSPVVPDARVPDRARDPKPDPPSNACQPGDRRWCDGLMYSGWGQVACDPTTGRWREKIVNGKATLDCQELATAERPNTVCACYHFFFNPSCCERPDCVLRAGGSGANCPPSKGALCDYCNPQKSECKEPKAKCIVTNQHETFCGRICSPTEPCPAGYQCMVVKLAGGATTNQCVPSDYSCYQ